MTFKFEIGLDFYCAMLC